MKLEPVPFQGDTVFAIDNQGEPFVPVKSIIENLGLSWPAQYRKLVLNSLRWGVAILAIPSPGGDQDTASIPLRKLSGFLATINPAKVSEKLRNKIIVYQEECDDVLHKYWFKGRAINRRFRPVVIPQSFPEALRAFAAEVEEREKLEYKIETNRPRVEYAEAVEESTGAITFGNFAKLMRNAGIKLGRNNLFKLLRSIDFLMTSNIPYQRYVDNGVFVIGQTVKSTRKGNLTFHQPFISGKGQIYLEKKIRESGRI